MLLDYNDHWVGEAISRARIAFETWNELQRGEIKIEPESSPRHLSPGGYVNLFINYAKAAFLNAVAALDRGFFEYNKDGVFIQKTEVACRMVEFVSEAQIDELRNLTAPLRTLRNKDHGTSPENGVDPSALYELLKSLEPTIGQRAFLHAAAKTANAKSE
jgi:hypothetical protein